MRAVLDILLIVLDLYIWILVIQAILSFLVVFNVVNPRNQVVSMIWRFTMAVTEPVLRPIRRIVPPLGSRKQYGATSGGIDLSPFILILGIILIQRVIIHYIYPNVF
jgi:YggT family protein